MKILFCFVKNKLVEAEKLTEGILISRRKLIVLKTAEANERSTESIAAVIIVRQRMAFVEGR